MAKSNVKQALSSVSYGLPAGATINVYHPGAALLYGDTGGLYSVGVAASRGYNTIAAHQYLTITLVDDNNFTVKSTAPASGILVTILGAGKITIS